MDGYRRDCAVVCHPPLFTASALPKREDFEYRPPSFPSFSRQCFSPQTRAKRRRVWRSLAELEGKKFATSRHILLFSLADDTLFYREKNSVSSVWRGRELMDLVFDHEEKPGENIKRVLLCHAGKKKSFELRCAKPECVSYFSEK